VGVASGNTLDDGPGAAAHDRGGDPRLRHDDFSSTGGQVDQRGLVDFKTKLARGAVGGRRNGDVTFLRQRGHGSGEREWAGGQQEHGQRSGGLAAEGVEQLDHDHLRPYWGTIWDWAGVAGGVRSPGAAGVDDGLKA